MKFAVRLPQDGPFSTPQNVSTVAKLSEELGYDAVFVHDHIHWSHHEKYHLSAGTKESVDAAKLPSNLFESLSTLTWVASRTERIRLGTAAVILPLRNPLIFARQLSTVQELSGGRLILSVCLGSGSQIEKEYAMIGVPFHRRGRIMEENLKILRDVLFTDKEAHSFQGKFSKFEDFSLFPKPKPFPIWYAGRSPTAYARAARLADGWIPGLNETPDRFKKDVPVLYDELRKNNREQSKFTIALETFCYIGKSSDEAVKATAETCKARGIEDLSWTFIGTVRESIDRIQALGKLGCTYFEVKFMVGSFDKMLNDIKMFAKEIMPSAT